MVHLMTPRTLTRTSFVVIFSSGWDTSSLSSQKLTALLLDTMVTTCRKKCWIGWQADHSKNVAGWDAWNGISNPRGSCLCCDSCMSLTVYLMFKTFLTFVSHISGWPPLRIGLMHLPTLSTIPNSSKRSFHCFRTLKIHGQLIPFCFWLSMMDFNITTLLILSSPDNCLLLDYPESVVLQRLMIMKAMDLMRQR